MKAYLKKLDVRFRRRILKAKLRKLKKQQKKIKKNLSNLILYGKRK